jgi:iron complex outermembrane recepter protein
MRKVADFSVTTSLYGLAVGILLLGSSQAAYAQATPATPTPDQTSPQAAPADPNTTPDAQPADTSTQGDIVVTGFRASVASAINAKRSSISAIDVIKADDIAQFPDNNLADSIQRVPGVSINRVAGEGRNLTVRGLGPQYTRVRVNGMEAQSTSGASDASGGVNLGRSFDFNTFASELFNSITVHKTQEAEIDEGSLGATVDLQTAHPFDFKKTTATFGAEGQYNDLRGRVDPRLVGLFSTTTPDGKFGVLISGAYSQNHRYEEEFGGGGGWDKVTTNGGFCAPVGITPINPSPTANPNFGASATNCSTGVARPANTPENDAAYATAMGSNVHIPHLPRYGRVEYNERRLGLTGSLQWRPSDHTLLTFDALYSKYNEERQEEFLDGFSFSRALSSAGVPQMIVRDAHVNTAGDLDYGVFDNVDIRAENRMVKDQTTFKQFTLTGRQDLASWWRIDGLIGVATSDFSNPYDVTVTMDRANTQGYSFDFRNNSRQPVINYGYDVNDPNAYTFTSTGTAPFVPSEARVRQFFVKNQFKTVALNSTMDLAPDFTFKFGGAYKRFSFDSTRYFRNTPETTVPGLPAGVTLGDLVKTVSGFGSGMNLQGATPTSWIVPDVTKFDDALHFYSGQGLFALGSTDNAQARGSDRSVVETTKSVYGEIQFTTHVLPFAIRGDVGVRYISTDQTASGYQVQSTVAVLGTTSRSYDRFLPSLNLTADLRDNLLLRFGASKVLARPDLGSLSPGASVVATGTRSVSFGNPDLDPIEASTIDVSLEWYPKRDTLVSIAYFHKDISSFIQTVQTQVPFSQLVTQFGLPLSLLNGTTTVPSDIFNFSQPVNTPGGPLNGVEVNVQSQLPLKFLPTWLNHFGILANYTHVASKITYNLPGGLTTVADLTGLSKNAANGTLYYDNGKFSLRGSVAYRSGFLTAIPAPNAGSDIGATHPITTVDAAMSYSVNAHLKLKLEGLNLTDVFTDQYEDSVRNSSYNYVHSGRQIDFGFQYKF